MTKPWLPLALLALLAACQKPAEETPTPSDSGAEAQKPADQKPEGEKPAGGAEAEEGGMAASSIFSPTKGDKWVYDLRALQRTSEGDRTGTGEFVMSIEDVETPGKDGVSATVKTVDPGKTVEMTWQIGPKGLLQLAGDDLKVKFDPPMPLVPPVLRTGERITWKGKGVRLDGTVGTAEVVVRVAGEEEVDTESGRMKAWSVESLAVWKGEDGESSALTTSWWSPKVGLVRMIRELNAPEYGLRTELRLKSHTVKQ